MIELHHLNIWHYPKSEGIKGWRGWKKKPLPARIKVEFELTGEFPDFARTIAEIKHLIEQIQHSGIV